MDGEVADLNGEAAVSSRRCQAFDHCSDILSNLVELEADNLPWVFFCPAKMRCGPEFSIRDES
jgi:hypothetical protein